MISTCFPSKQRDHDFLRIYYQTAFGKLFTDELYLSAEEIFTIVLQFAIDRTITLDLYWCDLGILFSDPLSARIALENEEYKAGSIIWNGVVKKYSKDLS